MPPDFLDSREDAILVWVVIGLAYAIRTNGRAVAASFLAVLRTVLHPKLLLLFGSTLAYSAGVVYAASLVGLWRPTSLKVTIYWYVGTAVVLVGDAVTTGVRDSRSLLRRAIGRIVAATVLVEFIVNVHAMPLAFELVGILIVLVFSTVDVVARHDPTTPPAAVKFIEGVLITVGLIYLGYFFVRALADLDGFLTRGHAEEFLVPPTLTLALAPLLLLAAWWSRREQEALRAKFRTRFNSPA